MRTMATSVQLPAEKCDLSLSREAASGRLNSLTLRAVCGARATVGAREEHWCRAARAVRFLKKLKLRNWWTCDA